MNDRRYFERMLGEGVAIKASSEPRQEEIGRAPVTLGVTASVGVAPVMPGDGPADSARRADKACYAAKVQGGNRVGAATFPT